MWCINFGITGMVVVLRATRSRVFPDLSYYLDCGTTPLKGGCRATNMSLLKSWHSIISVAFKAITKRSSTKLKSCAPTYIPFWSGMHYGEVHWIVKRYQLSFFTIWCNDHSSNVVCGATQQHMFLYATYSLPWCTLLSSAITLPVMSITQIHGSVLCQDRSLQKLL